LTLAVGVWRARDHDLQRDVAVKFLRTRRASCDGFAKILDFGLAKLRVDDAARAEQPFDSKAPTLPESPSPQASAGAVLGTVAYMSPEQERGRAVDHPDVDSTAAPLRTAVSRELRAPRGEWLRSLSGRSSCWRSRGAPATEDRDRGPVSRRPQGSRVAPEPHVG
jgi:hypothetical protein